MRLLVRNVRGIEWSIDHARNAVAWKRSGIKRSKYHIATIIAQYIILQYFEGFNKTVTVAFWQNQYW